MHIIKTKQKMEKQKKLNFQDRVQELLSLCVEYQNKDCGTAFFSISGHVSTVNVDLHPNGWKANSHPEISKTLYLQVEDGHLEEDFDNLISELREIIDNTKPFEERIKDMEEAERASKKEQLEKLAKDLNVKIVE